MCDFSTTVLYNKLQMHCPHSQFKLSVVSRVIFNNEFTPKCIIYYFKKENKIIISWRPVLSLGDIMSWFSCQYNWSFKDLLNDHQYLKIWLFLTRNLDVEVVFLWVIYLEGVFWKKPGEQTKPKEQINYFPEK